MIAKYRYQAYIWMISGSLLGFLLGHRLLSGIETPHKIVGSVILMLTVITGFLLGRLASMVCANVLERRALNILYQEREPEKFIGQYEKGLRSCRIDLAEYYTTANHLANAYAMKGDFSKATTLLENLDVSTLKLHQMGIQALITNSLTNWYLWNRQTEQAREKMDELEELQQIAEKRQPAVAQNLKVNLSLFKEHLAILDGQDFDSRLLEEILKYMDNPVFRQPTAYLYGIALLNSDSQKARGVLRELAQEPGSFWFSTQARLRLTELESQ